MYLQMLLCFVITSKTYSGKSLGCGEVNLNLILGKAVAARSSRSAKRAPVLLLRLYVSLNPLVFLC
jgi:hypothetical protein